jgi:hypothetical protein
MPSTVVETLRAWHRSRATIYHNNPQCSAGRRIQVRNYIQGTGDLQQCNECTSLEIGALLDEIETEVNQ